MDHALSQHDRPTVADGSSPAGDESRLWLPRKRMVTYQWVKLVGGLLMVCIFVGWMWLQWSNPAMRVLTIALCVVTGWVLLSSTIADLTRAHGRQIALEDDTIVITTPDGATRIRLADIDHAQWLDDTEEHFGLWLHGKQQNQPIRLDGGFFVSESEARNFLGWARRRADVHFEVRWPDAEA